MGRDGGAGHLLASGSRRRSTGDWLKMLREGNLLRVHQLFQTIRRATVSSLCAPNLTERRFTTIQVVP